MQHREPVEHQLKVAPSHFNEIRALRKKQEFRSTADRDFRVGDVLLLQEFVPEPRVAPINPSVQIVSTGYTGQEERRIITHILDKAGFEPVPEGWAILSLDVAPAHEGSNVESLDAITDKRTSVRGVLEGALDAVESEGLRSAVVVGWVGEGRIDFYHASSEVVEETSLLHLRGLHDIQRRLDRDELEAGNSPFGDDSGV